MGGIISLFSGLISLIGGLISLIGGLISLICGLISLICGLISGLISLFGCQKSAITVNGQYQLLMKNPYCCNFALQEMTDTSKN